MKLSFEPYFWILRPIWKAMLFLILSFPVLAAANTSAIFSKVGNIQWGSADGNGGTAGPLKTANTAKDGTGTVLTIFTADATNGGFVQRLIVRAAGTNVATVLRVFVNNGSTNATLANNSPIAEKTIPATTLSETSELAPVEIPINAGLDPGFKLNVTIGTTVAAGLFITAIGGKY